jgi:Gpi18-like mannosyltransferase
MIGVGVLSAMYYRDRSLPAPFAIALALVVVITPAFVFFATSTVMSEPLFTLAEVAAVVLIGRRRPILGGVTAAAATLVRSAGLPILLAATIWY